MQQPLKPKQITLTTSDDEIKVYTISKFDCISGRELATQYPLSNLPKMAGGNYKVSEEMMLKLMSFVYVEINDVLLPLTTMALVKQHVPDWELLAQVEFATMQYNCSFFQNGRLSDTLASYAQKYLRTIAQMLTASSEPSSEQSKPPSTN